MMDSLRKVNARISRFMIGLGGIGLIVMTCVLFWQVFTRYVLQSSASWTEQVAVVLTIWFVMLGAAGGVQEGFHIRIVEGVERMTPAWAARARALAHVLAAIFGLGLTVFGIDLVIRTWPNAVPALPLTRGMVYAVIPFSGFLMSVFALGHLHAALQPNRDSR